MVLEVRGAAEHLSAGSGRWGARTGVEWGYRCASSPRDGRGCQGPQPGTQNTGPGAGSLPFVGHWLQPLPGMKKPSWPEVGWGCSLLKVQGERWIGWMLFLHVRGKAVRPRGCITGHSTFHSFLFDPFICVLCGIFSDVVGDTVL